MLIPVIARRKGDQLNRNILALPEWSGSLKPMPWSKPRVRFVNQSNNAPRWTNRISVTSGIRIFPRQIITTERSEKLKEVKDRAERIDGTPKDSASIRSGGKKKESSAWLTVPPLQDLGLKSKQKLGLSQSSMTSLYDIFK